MSSSPPDDGWTGYAPLGASVDACSFCREPRTPERQLMAAGDGSVAICEECVSRFAGFFARRADRHDSDQ
ncbi:MAG: hypothetical protein AVDCRST_MAG65-1269 [uncultured Solirubrobacteraceae bacterium]|uniref:ATP-dependent Clp protease ATP-binding subunit ClpX zinc ribbon domain-containing protein n=1 Tax=uncultured Solirubrobacteraceae bacterium TaxID=1162706 RepID=A0A6J4RNW8_9ACTN|nr:MAG: hypothetical protein AVDCRST_MAG65-1269 [uncultured Solirubrobacteraceae bacterium]